jgi:hypothetical protein
VPHSAFAPKTWASFNALEVKTLLTLLPQSSKPEKVRPESRWRRERDCRRTFSDGGTAQTLGALGTDTNVTLRRVSLSGSILPHGICREICDRHNRNAASALASVKDDWLVWTSERGRLAMFARAPKNSNVLTGVSTILVKDVAICPTLYQKIAHLFHVVVLLRSRPFVQPPYRRQSNRSLSKRANQLPSQ